MSKRISGTFIPDEILDAEDLKPVDVRILIELRRVEKEDDGSVHVKARRLALRANCDEKTIANRIRLMAENGWLKILAVSEGGGGGFRLQFLRAAVIVFLLLPASALHNANYILPDKRRNRHKRLSFKPKPADNDAKIQTRRILKTGQWALWNLPQTIHA